MLESSELKKAVETKPKSATLRGYGFPPPFESKSIVILLLIISNTREGFQTSNTQRYDWKKFIERDLNAHILSKREFKSHNESFATILDFSL